MADENGLHVVFGTGPAGLAVMDELLARGERVRMVNLRGQTPLPEGVELMSGNAIDTEFSTRACQGASVVYQALNAPYAQWSRYFPPLQRGVIEGVAAAGARLVTLENVYMYGSPGGKPLTEETPYHAHTRKGGVRQAMTEELMQAHKAGKVRAVIGRASDFFGPRVLVSAMGERVFPPALNGKAAQLLGNPDMPHTYTYMPDIGKALVILGERDEALGQAWHLPNPKTVTTRRFVEMIFEEIGAEPKIQAPSKPLLRMIAFFNSDLRATMEMLYQFEEPFVVDSSKFEAAFGMTATPLKDAIAATVAWYRGNLEVEG
jgi:nucleoside-diphosphate-sugar epimerase